MLVHLPPSVLSIPCVHVVDVLLPGSSPFVSFPSQRLYQVFPHASCCCISLRSALQLLLNPPPTSFRVRLSRRPRKQLWVILALAPRDSHNHFQVASISSLLGWLSSNSSRQPHTVPTISHYELRSAFSRITNTSSRLHIGIL